MDGDRSRTAERLDRYKLFNMRIKSKLQAYTTFSSCIRAANLSYCAFAGVKIHRLASHTLVSDVTDI